MLPYSIIMFVTSGVFLLLSILIYNGNTDLIHSYHQTKVKDKNAYGKSFGKALSVLAVTLFASGIVGLLGHTEKIAGLAVFVLIIGLIAGLGCILVVQKKHNNGVF